MIEKSKSVFLGSSIALVMRILAAGLELGFNILLVKIIGVEEGGAFVLGMAITQIGTVFGRVGLDNVLLRHVAANVAIGRWDVARDVYNKSIGITTAASVITTAVVYLSAPFISIQILAKPELIDPIRIMSLTILPISLMQLNSESLKGIDKIFYSQLFYSAAVPGLLLAGLLIFGGSYGLNGILWSYIAASWIVALGSILVLRMNVPGGKPAGGEHTVRSLLKSSVPLFWVKSMNLAMGWAGILALGIWGTKADVAIFNITSRIILALSMLHIAVNSISAPRFAALYKQNDFEELNALARSVTKLVVGLTAPLFLLLFVMPLFADKFIIDPDLNIYIDVLMILTFGQLINVFTGPVNMLLMMSAHERLVRNNNIFAAMVNFALNIFLVPQMGVRGAAIALAVGLLVVNIISMYLVWKNLRIMTTPIIPQKVVDGWLKRSSRSEA